MGVGMEVSVMSEVEIGRNWGRNGGDRDVRDGDR